ncbi:MAG: hypothetical protein H0U71_07935 [Gammaproteobacteria bacterium]|nr:hypothetical protein [Gammaproteobacteria bacterium]
MLLKSNLFYNQVYFSDDITILPGDGEVISLGDARAYWNPYTKYTISDGFPPFYLHRSELDKPETKIKIEQFVANQKQNSHKFISARVEVAKSLILSSSDHYKQLSYLCGESLSIYTIKSEDELKFYLQNLYSSRNNLMTAEKILENALKISDQTAIIHPEAKNQIYLALNMLSTKKYSKTLLQYLRHRPDFIIIVHPYLSILPSLDEDAMSAVADFTNNRVLISGTSRYDIHKAIEHLKSYPFIINKDNNIAGPLIYGGYSYYSLSFKNNTFDFSPDYNHPIAQHGLRKIESLIIEECSDFINVLLSGHSMSGTPISPLINSSKNSQWLSAIEEVEFRKLIETTLFEIKRLHKIIAKLKDQKTLTDKQQEIWLNLRENILTAEKNLLMSERFIITEVDLSAFPDLKTIKIGDHLVTPQNSRWAGVSVIVTEIKQNNNNWLSLALKAPPLPKDHVLHHYYLEELLFQIETTLNPGPIYPDYWLPKEVMGRLRGLVDNYPVAEELLIKFVPFFAKVEKNIISASLDTFSEYIKKVPATNRVGLLSVTSEFFSNFIVCRSEQSTDEAHKFCSSQEEILDDASHALVIQHSSYGSKNTGSLPFDAGAWDADVKFHSMTNEPIFTYHFFNKGQKTASIEFYGQKGFCRSSDNKLNNIVKITSILNEFNIADEMVTNDVCQVLPPNLFQRLWFSTKEGALYGGAKGFTNVIGRRLKSNGFSTYTSYCVSGSLFYAGVFVMKYKKHYDQNETFDAMYQGAIETGQFFLINTFCNFVTHLLASAEKTCYKNKYPIPGKLFKWTAVLSKFGAFFYNSKQEGLLEASTECASAAVTQTAIESIGNYFIP